MKFWVVGLQGHVKVGSTETKGADTGTTRVPVRLGPSHRLGWHEEGVVRPIHGRVWGFESCAWRDGGMVQRHGDFQQTGHPGRGLEVTNLAFDGPNSDVVACIESRPKGPEGGQFRGITDLGGGPMRLDQFHG